MTQVFKNSSAGFISRNLGAIAISAIAVSAFGAYVAVPTDTAFASLYTRYVAKEETRARIFEDGIEIKFNREAPPVAALEEALRDQPWATIERSPSFAVKATELTPALHSLERVAGRIIVENQRAWAQIAQFNREEALRIAQPLNRRPLSTAILAGASVSHLPAAPTDLEKTDSALRPSTVTHVVKISAAKREQLLASLLLPMATPPAAPAVRVRRALGPNTVPAIAPVTSESAVQINGLVAAASEIATETPMGRVAPQGRQILIRGPIEFSGGLAVTHAGDRLVVLRESDGHFAEAGSVSMRDARYEIYVESLDGRLVAELRAPHGDVIGRGQFELGKIQLGSDQRKVDGVLLQVTPIATGLVGQVRSAYARTTNSGADTGIRGAKVEIAQTPIRTVTKAGGVFEERRLEEGSRVVATLSAKNHRVSMATLIAGQESVVPLFSNKMIDAFEGLSELDPRAPNNGLIWGRVVRNGQPVEGANVEILTEGTRRPVYFSELMIPDPSRTETSSNGLFAIPVLAGNIHSLQVSKGGLLSDPILTQVAERTVAPMEFELAGETVYPAKAFDAFRTDWPVAVDVRPMGHSKGRTVRLLREASAQRPHRVRLRHFGHPIALDLEAGPDYVRTRVIQNPETRYLLMPMVQKAWLDRIVGRLKFNPSPNDGAVIGFIQGSRFQVSVGRDALNRDARILYFDFRGEFLPQAYGEPGGGFLILGIKTGMQTVMVAADGGDHVFATSVLVDHDTLSTINHWLR